MADSSYLNWPFFEASHRAIAGGAREWAAAYAAPSGSVDDQARAWVRDLGTAGWLRYVVPAQYGGAGDPFDVRAICLVREQLAYQSGLGDFAFAMQGLGTGPISLFGTEQQKQLYLPAVGRGEKIAAFAISEKEAGSDLASMRTLAWRDGDHWVLHGEKAWISNAGIADHYVVFSRVPELGEKAYGAFIVDANTAGLRVAERVEVIAPHVLGTIALENCRLPESAVIGDPASGLKVALATLDVFRTSVAAAALGFARRGLDEAVKFTIARQQFGQMLASFQLTQARLADMATAIDASALLVYRAAWTKDSGTARITREAAMAKLFSTESAQRVIDDAVQLHGGRGVVSGEVVERLYREIRALRIYEGTSEIQKIVIAHHVVGQ
ncbi:MAG: acyl-CoA dehydrogenase family protein [Gemmatimonadota bacterium]